MTTDPVDATNGERPNTGPDLAPTAEGDAPEAAGSPAGAPEVQAEAAKPPAPPPPPPPPPPHHLGDAPGPIEAADTFAIAGRKAMWLHVDRMLAREAAIRDPKDPDSLRKYRVATRRLRAAMRLFREAYPAQEIKPVRDALGVLAREVGAVRDLDVRIADLDSWAEESGVASPESLAPLRDAWATQRLHAAAALERRLESKRHRRLLETLASFVTSRPVATPGMTGTPAMRTVRDSAASSAWLAYERLRAYTSTVHWADLDTLHGIRIEAKRLRYTLEFLGPVIGMQRDWLVARLVALQDHLGHLNDAAVTAAAIRAFLEERHSALQPGQRQAIEAYLVARERAVTQLRRGVGRAWRPIVGVMFAGRLGRSVIVRAST